MSVSWCGIAILFIGGVVSPFPTWPIRSGLTFGSVTIFDASASSWMDICVNCVSLTGRGFMGPDVFSAMRAISPTLKFDFGFFFFSVAVFVFFVNADVDTCRVAHDRLFSGLIVIINDFGTARSATFGCPIASSASLRPSVVKWRNPIVRAPSKWKVRWR